MKIVIGIINVLAWVGGSLLIGYQFGWKAGAGAALLSFFVKGPEGK